MNKKFFSALMFGALLTASTGAFVSCADYDDDISGLQAQIDKLTQGSADKTELSTVQSQLSTIQGAASAAQTTADAANKAAAAAATAAAEAQKAADAAAAAGLTMDQVQAAALEAAAKAEEAAKAAAEAAAAKAKADALAEVEAELKAVIEAMENKADAQMVEVALSLIQGHIEGIDEVLNQLGDGVAANASEIKTLKDEIVALAAALEEQKMQDEIMAQFAEMMEGLTNLGLVLDNVNWTLDIHQAILNDLGASVEELQAKLAVLEATALTTANLDTKLADVNKAIAENKESIATLDETVNGLLRDIMAITGKGGDLDAINIRIDEVEGSVDELWAKVMVELAGKGGTIDEINVRIDNAVEELQAKQQELADKVAAIEGKLNSISVLAVQRLSSLVFAPSRYINGIEAIEFKNFKYEDWGSAWKADAPKTGKYFNLDEVGATAKYMVSPSNIDVESYDLTYVLNDATNTRATKTGVTLTVATKEVKDGILSLGLKKNGAALPAVGTDAGESLVIASLKAALKEDKKDKSEAGKEIAVFSDWARIVETTVTPYIHNTKIRHTNGTVCNAEDSKTVDSHFWAFTEIYNKAGRENDQYTSVDEKNFVAAEQVYSQPLDLLSLVTVCINKDDKTELVDYAKYGLEYEFNIIKYLVKNEEDTKDASDQALYGVIKEGHMLHSTARNGMTDNADAVGRTPVIQAVLKDVKNNAVVDVRYFKVLWTPTVVKADTRVWEAYTAPTVAFNCTDSYEGWIYEEYMNNLYATVVEGGYSKDTFHQYYKLDGKIYAGAVTDAVKNDVATGNMSKYNVIGQVIDVVDNEATTQTHNIKIDCTGKHYPINPTEEQDFTQEGFFVYSYGKDNIIIPIKIVVKAGTYSNVYNYFGSQWSTGDNTVRGYVDADFNVQGDINKFRSVNPTLWSDSKLGNAKFGTTQLTGSLTFGYIKNGEAPASINDLVAYKPYNGSAATLVGGSDIVFDSSRLTMLPKGQWNLSDDEKILYDGLIPAAEIVGNNVYLIDNAAATGTTGAADAQPTAAALRLVGEMVPVKVVATHCNPIDFDKYLVNFIKPLKFEQGGNAIELIDVKNGADSEPIKIEQIIKLKENFGQNSAQIYIFGAKKLTAENQTLIDWYEVEDVTVDTKNARTNLNLNGGRDAACNTLLSKILNEDKEQSYIINYDAVNDKLSFHNASGNAIAKGYDFNIEVPVKVDTKWQKGLEAQLKITIKSGL